MPSAVGDFITWIGLGAPAFLFVITVVVFFHELGHFAMARAFGVAVQAFSIGFGRELVGWTDRKGTRWKICLLPLGGYVKFLGDADASSRPDNEAVQQLNSNARDGVLHLKPLYQRALVVAAGPLANFVLAIVIFATVALIQGKPSDSAVVGVVTKGSAAEAAGLEPGDRIQSVNGTPVVTFIEVQRIIRASGERSVRLDVARGDRVLEVNATPKATETTDALGKKQTLYLLGIANGREPVGAFEAVRSGAGQTWFIVDHTLRYLGQMLTGHAAADQLSGPLGIAKVSGDMAALGFIALMELAGLISVSIGLLNLFPIPVLDGGHLLYYACEAVLGRPLGERAQEVGFRLGLALVLSLMLLATFNDLVRFNLF